MERTTLAYSIAAVAFIAFGAVVLLPIFNHRPARTPHPIYFELTALTADGQPVVGAQVYIQHTQVGVTDSYGQWNKTHTLALSHLLHLSIEKTGSNGDLIAVRNIPIPDTHLYLNLPIPALLIPDTHQSLSAENPEVTPEVTADTQHLALTFKLEPKAQLAHLPHQNTLGKSPAVADGISSLWFQASPLASSATVEQKQHYGCLEMNIIPALNQEARRLGIKIYPSSSWQIRLSSIDTPEQPLTPALLRVQGRQQADIGALDFIVSATPSPLQIASDIFKKLSLHKKNLFQSKGWKKYSLRLFGLNPRKATIFIAGIKATPTHTDTWEYWGRDQHQANLSVIEENRLTFRRRIVMGSVAELTLPSEKLSSPKSTADVAPPIPALHR